MSSLGSVRGGHPRSRQSGSQRQLKATGCLEHHQLSIASTQLCDQIRNVTLFVSERQLGALTSNGDIELLFRNVDAHEYGSFVAHTRASSPGAGPDLARPCNQAMRVEHEDARAGALVYLAAWDVDQARLFGLCEPRNGIAAFGWLLTS